MASIPCGAKNPERRRADEEENGDGAQEAEQTPAFLTQGGSQDTL
jgi:hypothetical protein